MTVASTLSLVACALELLVGLLCLGFARAPGWARLRLFSLVALSAALYSASNVPQTLTADPRLIVPASQLSLAAGGLHLGAWLLYSRGHGAERAAGPVERWLGGALAAAAALAAVPGVLARPSVHVHEVPWLGLRYHTAEPTPLALAAFLAFLAGMTVPAVRFLGAARRGVPGSRLHLAGFLLLLGAAVAEILTASGLARLPYLLDLGFLVAVLPIGAEVVRRAAADAGALTDLTARLERTVEARTAELARTQEALARAERLSALGRFAGGLAHQVNSPLSAITANAGFLQAELAAAPALASGRELREALGEIKDAAARIRDVVLDLKVFARGPSGLAGAPTDVRRAIDSALRVTRHALRHPEAVRIEEDGAPRVAADPALLAQVLVHLIDNAAQALPPERREGSGLAVRARARDGGVLVEVEDEGCGISAEHLPRVFEPFFTTREAAGASGLGLSVVHGLVTAMGGRIEVDSAPGRGTRVGVWLPAFVEWDAPPGASA